MAGSFEIFRKYQRALLVCVAILAMLAFFVLPPFLQMGSSTGAADPLAVSWNGGGLTEAELERTVALRSVVNRFLMEAAAAGGRDPSRMPLLPEGEEQTVQTSLLARDAAANGITVSDRAVNEFLGQWTGNMVRQEQFDEILSRLRLGPLPLSQYDLFAALRTELAARSILMLEQPSLGSDPPGWQWDYFRRLAQRATVEAVPIVVEDFAAAVPAPTDATLRSFFERYKNDLPAARSADPGFKEPHRVRYEYLVAKRGAFEDAAAKEVTDEQVSEYYEKNKATMFRARTPVAPETPSANGDAKPDAGDTKPAAGDAKPAAAEAKPAAGPAAPASDTKPAAEGEKPAEGGGTTPPAPAAPQGAAAGSSPFRTVAFQQPEGQPAAGDAATTKPEPEQFEPLDKVKDEIRNRLAREKVEARIDAIFTAVAGDLARFAEDQALWQARKPAGVEAPRPPQVAQIASTQGLESGTSDWIRADEAFAGGGIGGSFEFVPDPGSRFGIRQQRWIEQMFGSGSLSMRPIRSRDMEGNRYLSWRTEDQPEYTPTFEAARPGVERAWRIVEARALARQRAQEIAKLADTKGQALEAVLGDLPAAGSGAKPAATKVGPFSWLTAGPGGPPEVTEPAGISMPGDEFMRAVFALDPGRAAVAFNEPQTVCYVVRLVSTEPPTAELQERFLTQRSDRQSIGMVAQREGSAAFRDMLEQLEKRHRIEWKRPPRTPGR
jgi:hypothetical protein